MKTLRRVLWGIVWLVLAIALILDVCGIFKVADLLFTGWWTLFIILPCLIGFICEKDKTGNLIGLSIGVVLFFKVNGYIDSDMLWKLILATVLLFVGLHFLFGSIFRRQERKIRAKVREKMEHARTDSQGPTEAYNALFSGHTVDFSGKVFYGAELTATFGSVDLDLTNAILTDDAVITVNATFGGVLIKLPPNANAVIGVSTVFGGIEDERAETRTSEDPLHTVYIGGNAVFGGVHIE